MCRRHRRCYCPSCTREYDSRRPTVDASRPPARQRTRRPATTARGPGLARSEPTAHCNGGHVTETRRGPGRARCGRGGCAACPPRRWRSRRRRPSLEKVETYYHGPSLESTGTTTTSHLLRHWKPTTTDHRLSQQELLPRPIS